MAHYEIADRRATTLTDRSGNLLLTRATVVDLPVNPSGVKLAAGDQVVLAAFLTVSPDAAADVGTAGESVAALQPVYKDGGDDNRFRLASASGTMEQAEVYGLALHAAAADQPLVVILSGELEVVGTYLDLNASYVLSGTPGRAMPDSDLGNGLWRTDLFTAVGTSTVRVNVDPKRVQIGMPLSLDFSVDVNSTYLPVIM